MTPISPTLAAPTAVVEHLQAAYLALTPTIERIARTFFRHITCPDRKAECIAEAIALGWKWHLQMNARGNDPADFAVVFAYTLARAVHSGRRVCGQEKANDVLSRTCQTRRGVVVAYFPEESPSTGTIFDDALCDNTQTPVPDQVQFRIDFPQWRQTLADRDQKVLDAMATGERTTDLADRFGVSLGRVSQLREQFRSGWLAFCRDETTV